MKIKVENKQYEITGEHPYDPEGPLSILRSFANGEQMAERKIFGYVDDIALDDEYVFCLVHYRAKELGGDNKAVLSTFDMELHEFSAEILTSNPNGWFCSCMDETHIYILYWDDASADIEDSNGVSRSFDIVTEMTFTKIDRKSGERTEWKLDDFENDNECSEALEKAVGYGFVTSINSLHILDGKMVFECSVFEPDSVVENDDPDFNENELDNSDYVECHSYPCTVCADMDGKKLLSVTAD